MTVPITAPNISTIKAPSLPGVGQPAGGGSGDSFQSLLSSTIQNVEQTRDTAHAGMERFLAGDNQELHQTVMDVQKAELAFDLFLQMRNKVVAAYQEVMRMQL